MTLFGVAALVAGIAATVLGLSFDWLALDLIGIGLLAVLVIGFGVVARPSRLSIDREIQPPRVPKGSPAIALLTFANRSRRSHPVTVATQPFGPARVRTVIPRLRGLEQGSRAYRLPTMRRGIFDVPPLEVTRRDSFEFFRLTRQHASTERIWVYPRLLALRPLPTGQSRRLEGPSSETAPQGTITFHRLREYVAGDDLRFVHWRSSARAGKLLVKHNVDTSQPYSVVVLDQRPGLYTEESFEDAVDIAASAIVTCGRDKSPVELRTTDGAVLGGPRARDTTPLIDHLTGVQAESTGSLQAVLLALRRARSGTSLVVVTGELDPGDLPYLGALRRRYDRIVLVSIDALLSSAELGLPTVAGVRTIVARDADDACAAWNLQVIS